MLFVGKDEADQLRKIFSLLGEPDESAWPDYRKLASTRGFRFVTKDKATSGTVGGGVERLRSKFPQNGCAAARADETALSLLVLTHARALSRALCLWRRYDGGPARFPMPLQPMGMAGMSTSLSNTGFTLLMRCLTSNPVARITAAEALKQRWFQQRPVAEALTTQRLQELSVASAAAAMATQAATQATQMAPLQAAQRAHTQMAHAQATHMAQMAAAAAAAKVNPAQMAAHMAALAGMRPR